MTLDCHPHVHDAHHQHPHGFPWDGTEPHTHEHRHEAITHRHPHYPDIHHQHRHERTISGAPRVPRSCWAPRYYASI